MRRALMALAASLAVPAGAAVALPAASASASRLAPTIVTCTGLKGTAASTTASGCSNPAITGGSGKVTSNATGTTFKVTWKSGKTSTGSSVPTVLTTSKCPSGFPTEISDASTVKGGTAKALIGGKTTNKICVNTTTSPIKAEKLPGTKYKI